MNITKMLMFQVGTYNDVFQRPYQSYVDGDSLLQLQEATHGGKNLTPGALGGIGSDIMRLTSTVSGNVPIDNGFDTTRICFMMEVEFPGTGGIQQVEWLMGYTDYCGVSAAYGDTSVHFDPNMRLYFNNILRGRRIVSNNAFGRGYHTSTGGAFQLINADYKPSITNLHQMPHLMRPQDVFTSMSMADTRQLLGDEEVIDVRATHGPERIAVSHRGNTIPGNYLSRMLTAWQAQTASDDVDPSSMNSNIAAIVAEPTISRMRSMNELAVSSELRQGGSVTWRELVDVDDTRTLEDRVVVILAQSDRTRSKLAHRGDMQVWNGNGTSTLIAAEFVQAVPGLMMNLLLTELDFSVTNKTLDGSWEVLFTGVQSFNDGDNISQTNAFRHRLITELMPGLSRGNLIPMEIHASFNVMAQTFVEIDISDGEGFVPYMTPSFCDGLFAPVRAPDAKTLDRFADNLSRLTANLEQDYSAGGFGYEPKDPQFTTHNQGFNHEDSGSL